MNVSEDNKIIIDQMVKHYRKLVELWKSDMTFDSCYALNDHVRACRDFIWDCLYEKDGFRYVDQFAADAFKALRAQ